MKDLLGFINSKVILFSKDNRNRNIAKSVIGLSIIKGVTISLNLLILPLTIRFVSPNVFGIWITLSSILLWVSFFDIGFTNGLRNKLAEAFSLGDAKRAKELISTTYVALFVIFTLAFLLLVSLNYFLDWSNIIQITKSQAVEVKQLIYILIGFFCLQFVLRIVCTICLADQKPFTASLIDFLGQAIGFIILLFGLYGGAFEGNLINLGIVFTVSPLMVFIISSLYLFLGRYKSYVPSFSSFSRKSVNDIFGLGFKFFIIQLAGLIQYQTASFFIAHNFDPENVTAYNVAYKYFAVLNMVYNILLTPQWSAVTEAYIKKDFSWIKRTVNTYLIIAILFAIVGVIMLFSSDYAYKLWLREDYFIIDKNITLYTAIFFITANFSGLFISVLNGMGIIKLQYYLCFITPLVFLGSYYVLQNILHMGIASVLIASILSNLSGLVFAPIQYWKFMSGEKGVWAL